MLAALLDLVLPLLCAGCGERVPAGPVCPSCLVALAPRARTAVPVPCPPGLPPVVAAGEYAGALRRLVVAHKDRGRRAAAPVLAGLLAVSIGAAADMAAGGPVVLVPVPSSRAARRRRGGDDPLGRVVRAAAARQGAAVLPALAVRRTPADQAGLDARARAANLAGAFVAVPGAAARDPGPRACVLLVDDVLTTGATLAEAARALAVAGIAVRGCAVIAATRRRGPAV